MSNYLVETENTFNGYSPIEISNDIDLDSPEEFFRIADEIFKHHALYSNRGPYKRRLLNSRINEFLTSNFCKTHYEFLYNFRISCKTFDVFKVSFYGKILNIFCPICGDVLKPKSSCEFQRTCGKKDCIDKQHRKVFLEIYGCENPSQSPIIKEKKCQTTLKNYGVKHALQSKSIFNKMLKRNKMKWGDEFPARLPQIKEKSKATSIKKYGVDNPHKDPVIIEKTKETCRKKYGGDGPQSSEDVREKTKKTVQAKFGVGNISQSREIQNKKIQTNLKKFGTAWYIQKNNPTSKYKYENIYFDSGWELAYYIYLRDNKINFSYHSKKFEYKDSVGNLHYYFPDFIVDGKIVEIKGDFLIDEKGNLINPYDKSKEGEDILKRKQELMESLDVKILKEADVFPYIKYVEKTYGKNYIKEFKIK